MSVVSTIQRQNKCIEMSGLCTVCLETLLTCIRRFFVENMYKDKEYIAIEYTHTFLYLVYPTRERFITVAVHRWHFVGSRLSGILIDFSA
jgi:hypothetical protein